jgi:putative DNA primase/helicase
MKELQKQVDKLKLRSKHFIILTIENISKVAEANNWGLCKNNNCIYLFNGEYWKEIDSKTFEQFLGVAAEKMGVAKFDARFYEFRDKLYKQFLSSAYLTKSQSDNSSVCINLRNGTFEIKTTAQQLRPFNRNDFMTYQLPFMYDCTAGAPMFQSYLNRVLPDIELQNILAEYIGYLFIQPSTLKLEKALLLFGTGANGKSVFFEIVNALLGLENFSSFTMQSLTDVNGYSRAEIANKLVNYASEINGKLQSSILKQLISCEPVEARSPYGNPFTMTNYAKLIFNCNELPKEVEHSHAYFRRFLIVPFNQTIPEAEQDKELATKIVSNELSGVFNWVLEGLNRLLVQKNFTQSDIVKQMVDQYKKESDSVSLFMEDEEYKSDLVHYTSLKVVQSDYKTYCLECGYHPVGRKELTSRLRNRGIPTERISSGTIVYIYKETIF